MEGCEGGCTEPSKLLSNEPQASCRNSRSKFPRRPCFSIYLVLFPYLSPSFFPFLHRKSHRRSSHTYIYIYTHSVTATLYLLRMRALSSVMFSMFFVILAFFFFVSFVSAFLDGICWRIRIPSCDYASSPARCESRPLTCPGSRMTGYVRRCVNERSTRDRERREAILIFFFIGWKFRNRASKGSRSIKDGQREAERAMYRDDGRVIEEGIASEGLLARLGRE